MNLVSAGRGLKVKVLDFPVNRGGLCQKGWSAAELLDHPERLTTPLIRDAKGRALRPASWDEALERITFEIRSAQASFGPDAVGVFGGGSLTNEKAYSLGKFARVALRTSHIDYNGRFCMSSAASAAIKALGLDRGLPFPLADIPHAETILLIGSNAAETMPPVMQYFDAQRANGGSLIVVDPRKTPTAQAATLHLQITPGTDAALANGLLHLAVRQDYLDEGFIASRTNGFESVKRVASSYWPDRVERITGIPEVQLLEAARLLGTAATTMILTARGSEQQSHGVDNVLSFINLALALGKAGRPHCGYGCLTGQGNGQGGREHGQKADQLPGYRRIDNPQHRAHIAQVWGVREQDLPSAGCSAYEMLDQLGTDGGVRALLVFGSNLVVSAPKARQIEKRLDGSPTLVPLDEAWVYLRHPLFRERVRDWLKTLRKFNGAVLLATQNLSDIFNSPIRDVVLESCPTKILLPNAEAANPASRQFYESIGLNDREIEMVQKSIPKRQYYVVSPIGRRMIALGLGGVALSFVGVNGREERQQVEGAIELHGEQWPAEWLRMRGLPEWAAYLEQKYMVGGEQ